MKRKHVVIAFLVLLMFLGCVVLRFFDDDTFVPTSARLERHIPEFTTDTLRYEGAYASIDVPCAIYIVESGNGETRATVVGILKNAGFTPFDEFTYIRGIVVPPHGSEALEIVKVSRPVNNRLVLGFLHNRDLPSGWKNNIRPSLWDSGWPKYNLWKRYNRQVEELIAHDTEAGA